VQCLALNDRFRGETSVANIEGRVYESGCKVATLGEMFWCLTHETPSTIHMSQESQDRNVLVHFGLKPKKYTLSPLKHPLVTTPMKDIAYLLDHEERERRQIRFHEGPPTNHPKDEIVPLGKLEGWLRDDVKTFLTYGREYSTVFKEGTRIKKLTDMVCSLLRRGEFRFLQSESRRHYTTIWEAALAIQLLRLVILEDIAKQVAQHLILFHVASTRFWGCDAIDTIENEYKGLMSGVISNRSASFIMLQQSVEAHIDRVRPMYRSLVEAGN
jgi:hypothetical protein